MKKRALYILIFAVIVAFAGSDYFFNIYRQFTGPSIPTPSANAEDQNLTQALLTKTTGFSLEKRLRTTQLFEKIDLSSVRNIRAYRNELKGPAADKGMVIYEIHGPAKQGSLTYLNVKLALLNQIDATMNINEDSKYGHNSFYFNDVNNPTTGFLFTQIGDNCFAFQYNKTTPDAFETVKMMIDQLLLLG